MFEKYGKEFYMSEGESAKRASEILLPYILERMDCRSIIDFGCETGEWLKIAKNFRGRNKEEVEREITGIDGEYAKDYLQIQEDEFIPFNLCEKIDLNRKYDLAMSLEVAEHLPEDKADIFVDNITKHSDIVLFSAAIPGQGGYEHYNEQHVSYWKEKFAKHGYKMCDCIRKVFWRDDRIDVFYRQNMVLYVKEELKENVEEVFYTEATIDDMVHPWLWEERVLDKKR